MNQPSDDLDNAEKLVVGFYSARVESALSAQIEGGFRLAQEIVESCHLAITNLSCGCRVSCPDIKNHNLYSYSRMSPRILEENARGNLDYLAVDCIPQRSDAYAAFDWDVYLEVGASGKVQLTTCQLGIDVWLLTRRSVGAGVDSLLGLCSRMSRLIDASYGFATIMPVRFMPRGYTTGLMGRASPKLVWDANSWSRGAWKEFATRLRNVHGMNFVSRQHLSQRVGEQSLREWIVADPDRGSLIAWENDMQLWSFAGTGRWPGFLSWDNPAVCAARDGLERHKFFPWQEFVAARRRGRGPGSGCHGPADVS